jgi:predicted Zn finger-like uncharacterized protein
MLVNCNSCQKKFLLPGSEITESGRLLQCGSCGNKWTQYPIKEKVASKNTRTKKITKKKKREISLYSKEYLAKKHGLQITDNTSDHKVTGKKKVKNGLGFYRSLVMIIIFLIFISGLINLNEDLIIRKYPATEIYIANFFEVFDIIKITILELLD